MLEQLQWVVGCGVLISEMESKASFGLQLMAWPTYLGHIQIKTVVQNVFWTTEITLARGLTGIFAGDWRFKGQPDGKGAALSQLAGHFNAAAVRFNQPIGNGET